MDVECGKLEIVGKEAFQWCKSLPSINLPSVEVVEECAFEHCDLLTDVIFGIKLERFEWGAFEECTSLERITIPLKDGLIPAIDRVQENYIFDGCVALTQVDLVKGPLHETIAALQLEDWRNNMSAEIDPINQILPSTSAGRQFDDDIGEYDDEEISQAIRTWIRSVILKIRHYKQSIASF